MTIDLNNTTVAVMGVGYIGLPLVEAFGKRLRTIGYDTNLVRIKKLQESRISPNKNITFSNKPDQLKDADFIIICVPTPVSESKEPDLTYVMDAAEVASRHLKKGAIVVLESTVYPGATEEIMVPALEKAGLTCGVDFKVAYSPERINPGDNLHTIDRMTKVVAGMDEDTTEALVSLYGLIVPKVFKASDIKTAEAAKVIENTQRDLNIALMNELAMLFDKIGIDTKEVLDVAATKWNFVRYSPGLVGGHCIPVDPYYLVHKAKQFKFDTSVISAGRSTNDSMPKYVAHQTIKALSEAGKNLKKASLLIMGLTYKENVPDIRESPALQLAKELKKLGIEVFGFDPLLEENETNGFGIEMVDSIERIENKFDGVIVTVAHDAFNKLSLQGLAQIQNPPYLLFDVRRMFEREEAQNSGFTYLTL